MNLRDAVLLAEAERLLRQIWSVRQTRFIRRRAFGVCHRAPPGLAPSTGFLPLRSLCRLRCGAGV
jgi:hypothetical protein